MSGAARPKVVALVPVWRAAAFLAATLDRLAAQVYPNLEILISDDASPDESAAIGEAYAARDWRFRVLKQPRNLGWVGNVNALLAEARGDYFLFAFQDDLPAPDYVSRCVDALEARPRAIIAFSDIELVLQDGTLEHKSYDALDGLTDRLRRARLVVSQRGSWWIPNRGVFRAAAARAIGGLHRHLAGEFSADWPWLLHMSLLGEFVRIEDRLVRKIYLPTSLSRSWNFGAWSWTAVTGSAAREVARARVGVGEKLMLVGAMAGFLAKQYRRATRRSIGRALRRAGLRAPRRSEETPAR